MVHRTPQRMRIKIPRWKRQDHDFAVLQRALERCPGVVSVRVNALVASVVIHCRDEFEIMSVRPCFVGLELVLPASGPGRGRGKSPRLNAFMIIPRVPFPSSAWSSS